MLMLMYMLVYGVIFWLCIVLLAPKRSVYTAKHGGLVALRFMFSLLSAATLGTFFNYLIGALFINSGRSDVEISVIGVVVPLILFTVFISLAIYFKNKLDAYAYDYMFPDASSQLKNMKINEALLYMEGKSEELSKINQYCRKTIEIVTGFANNYTPGPVDCVNKNNYCACDILVFASQIIHDRMIKSGLDEAEKIADLYYSNMEQEIAVLCGANATQLDNYLSSRKFLRDTPEHTVEALVHVLTYDSVDLEKKNLCGWEVPDDSEAISSFDFDQNIWNHIIETADSLYDTIEKGFDEVFLKL